MEYKIILEETFLDYPSPEGNAVIVYFTGCEHHCPGCHSPLLQKVEKYAENNQEILDKIINFCQRADTNKLVFLGGDPLYSSNLNITKFLLEKLSNDYDICIFTGYDIDTVQKLQIKGAKYYKCGKFDINNLRQSKKTDNEYVLASPNQNFYDSDYKLISENGILTFNN